jgi:hypothetical protein
MHEPYECSALCGSCVDYWGRTSATYISHVNWFASLRHVHIRYSLHLKAFVVHASFV